MLKRTLTALFLIPPVIYLIGWSPKWLFVLAVCVAVILALREYFALCRAMNLQVYPWVGYGGALALCVVPTPGNTPAFPWSVALVMVVSTLALKRNTDLKNYLSAVSLTFLGIIYIGFTLSCLILIRFQSYPIGSVAGGTGNEGRSISAGAMCLLFMFLVIWAGDICAYLVGRPFGRIPFFARISPRKTWEGALAGLAGSLLAAWAFDHWFWKTGQVIATLLLAGWVAVAGQVGDLVESAIKRGANQKDSGTLLPGHGGFLDRIDSLLFAAPALWLAITGLLTLIGDLS